MQDPGSISITYELQKLGLRTRIAAAIRSQQVTETHKRLLRA